jgi:hypothetical protein
MERVVHHARPWRAVVTACLAALANPAWGENVPVEELRRELETMKQQMRQMQDKIDRQDEMIQKLGGAPPPTPPAAQPPPVAAAPPPAEPPVAAAPGRWSPAQPITLLSGVRGYLNLSFDALVDAGWSTNPEVTELQLGDHDPIQRGFTIPNTELFLDGAVDPYFRGAANLIFKLDEDNETEVELEEAYLVTTSLPWNLQAKAGQFLSEFGRHNQQHPHAWDFVDVPLVLGRLLGPEGLRNPGARLSWLVPTPFYAELLLGMQNSQGGTAFSFRNSEEELFGRPGFDHPMRGLGDFLYVPRAVASFDLTDSQTIVTGVSGALGPNASGVHADTQIVGGDVYWKWKPPWQSGGFPFVALQSEALGRRYEAAGSNGLPGETLYDWGLYGQVLYGFTQRWVAGLRGDWVSSDEGAFRPDENRADRARVAPNLTFYPTEFSKIRLQYNFDHGQVLGNDSSVWVQLEFLLGSHAAHKF